MMNVRPWRLFAVFAGAVLFASLGIAAPADNPDGDRPQPGAQTTVNSPAEFAAALRNPRSQTIALAPGNYGDVTLRGLRPGLRITAADLAAPPVFSSLAITKVDDLTLTDIVVKLATPPERKYQSLFSVEGVKGLRLTGLTLDGAAAGPEKELRGLLLQNSSQITITDSRFSGFFRALVGFAVSDVTLMHNDVSGMSSDGFDFAQAQNIMIARNRFGAFQATEESHADYVQFWSTGTEKASTDITVAENVMLQGQGTEVQGIFLEFEPRLPARNVTVRDNVIVQSASHGISLYNVIGATVERNLAVAIPASKYKVAIRLIGTSNGRLSQNAANAYGYEAIQNVVRDGNTEINFNDKLALANIRQAVEAFLDGNSQPPLVRLPISAAVRSAGIRPPASRR